MPLPVSHVPQNPTISVTIALPNLVLVSHLPPDTTATSPNKLCTYRNQVPTARTIPHERGPRRFAPKGSSQEHGPAGWLKMGKNTALLPFC